MLLFGTHPLDFVLSDFHINKKNSLPILTLPFKLNFFCSSTVIIDRNISRSYGNPNIFALILFEF